jgi:hypothetical protein
MATENTYRVIYHWENAGKIVNHTQIAYISAAANDYATLKAVLAAATPGTGPGNPVVSHGGSTLVIDNAVNMTPPGIFQ